MKLVTIVGARPQFIKAAVLSRKVKQLAGSGVEEVIIHTGQHFDHNMSQAFFDELNIQKPKYNLDIHSTSHGDMTGRMLIQLEALLQREQPDVVVLYGDTNSTLAGALAASKLHIPIAHIEAGLRSFNKKMPEEVNRVLTDQVSDFLFCPTNTAKENLAKENIHQQVYISGDIMYDSFLYYKERVSDSSKDVLKKYNIEDSAFVLTTLHRAENIKDKSKLSHILNALGKINQNYPVLLPLHPATKEKIKQFGLQSALEGLELVPPLSYREMIALLIHCRAVITDSGGLQKETYFSQKPCLTIREETEWVETLTLGHNLLTPSTEQDILKHFEIQINRTFSSWPAHYGMGDSGEQILNTLIEAKKPLTALAPVTHMLSNRVKLVDRLKVYQYL